MRHHHPMLHNNPLSHVDPQARFCPALLYRWYEDNIRVKLAQGVSVVIT